MHPAKHHDESDAADEPRGWYYRGRLPHCDKPGLIQFITWHLGDSLPVHLQQRVANQLATLPITEDERELEWRRKMEGLLDRGYGECWLRRKRCAQIVMDSLLADDGRRYHMHAFVRMPNHVHLLAEFAGGNEMGEVIGQWKGATAELVNAAARRSGDLWQDNYWDRYMRDGDHYELTIRYIMLNPIRAGLVKNIQQWPWKYRNPNLRFHRPDQTSET